MKEAEGKEVVDVELKPKRIEEPVLKGFAAPAKRFLLQHQNLKQNLNLLQRYSNLRSLVSLAVCLKRLRAYSLRHRKRPK